MRWKIAVGTGVLMLLVIGLARVEASEDGSSGAADSAAAGGGASTGTPIGGRLECPYDIRDVLPVRRYPEGASREAIAESARLRTAAADEATAAAGVGEGGRRLRAEGALHDACAGFARETAERRSPLGFTPEAGRGDSEPGRSECGRYCALLRACGGPGPEVRSASWDCLDECLARHFGGRSWVQRVAELAECRYL